jgi:CRP-like cAMP-binding protein
LEDSYFAEASLNSEVYHCTAECVKASRIQVIDALKMQQLLSHNAKFASQWILILCSELRRQRTSVERLNIRSAAGRIKYYILTEGNSVGELKLQGSLSDLSDMLGLSRESLYRALSKMEKSGELTRIDQTLKLKNSHMI